MISLSPSLCSEACANVLALTLAELPASEQEMRLTITQAMSRDCVRRCLDRASLESARCMAAARSALEAARCP